MVREPSLRKGRVVVGRVSVRTLFTSYSQTTTTRYDTSSGLGTKGTFGTRSFVTRKTSFETKGNITGAGSSLSPSPGMKVDNQFLGSLLPSSPRLMELVVPVSPSLGDQQTLPSPMSFTSFSMVPGSRDDWSSGLSRHRGVKIPERDS